MPVETGRGFSRRIEHYREVLPMRWFGHAAFSLVSPNGG